MLGESPQNEEVRRKIAQAAKAPIPVLILGETGSGKELLQERCTRKAKGANGPVRSRQ
jgi:DNA-binding NtrC family response regulator